MKGGREGERRRWGRESRGSEGEIERGRGVEGRERENKCILHAYIRTYMHVHLYVHNVTTRMT